MAVSLGIHIGHDGGAALMEDGNVCIAISEERLVRKKYANGWWNSLKACLDFSGLRLDDIDIIVFSNAGERLPIGFTGSLSKWATKLPAIHFVDHHLSHALTGYSLSGKDTAIAWVGDAGGNDNITQSAYVINKNKAELIMKSGENVQRFNGLGTTYEAFTNFLGFTDQESGKTMALASYGNPKRWDREIFAVGKTGEIISELDAPHYWGVAQWAQKFDVNIGRPFANIREGLSKDIAAFIQNRFEEALCESIGTIQNIIGIKDIVLSGGISLNCKSNTQLRTNLSTLDFFFNPLCSDSGLPLGNALYGQYVLQGEIPSLASQSLCLGPMYSENEVVRALQRHPDTVPPGAIRMGDLKYERVNDSAKIAAHLIAEGKIVAWWNGRSEFGPRALGARSILANPQIANIRDRINEQIKEREWFRPFGPSILRHEVDKYIETPQSFDYMIEAPYVTQLGRKILGECVHIDSSARVQTVVPEKQPEYARLLHWMKKYTGHAAVLNTSFNIQEPIVETPGDAVATFLRSGIDALVINDFVCIRK